MNYKIVRVASDGSLQSSFVFDTIVSVTYVPNAWTASSLLDVGLGLAYVDIQDPTEAQLKALVRHVGEMGERYEVHTCDVIPMKRAALELVSRSNSYIASWLDALRNEARMRAEFPGLEISSSASDRYEATRTMYEEKHSFDNDRSFSVRTPRAKMIKLMNRVYETTLP